jgi:HEAT repeat protein
MIPGTSGDEHIEPYKGLRPYEEKDWEFFFGRDTECKILIDKILANKLTMLFAASGVGKSSLLQAAVLPQLKDPKYENLDAIYYNDWVSSPLNGLKQMVLKTVQEKDRFDSDLLGNKLGDFTLKDTFSFCALFTRQPLVVILDQFEEFFQYQRYTAGFDSFIRQLSAIITDPDIPLTVVISMREDFALELNAFKPFLPTLLFANFYRLEKLDRLNAREAIEAPVKRVGFRYENDLLDTLCEDLAIREQGHHPVVPIADFMDTVEPAYLQIICSELWKLEQKNPAKTLRFKTYRDKGNATAILKEYVENVIGRFSAAEKQLASQAFDHLITRRGTKMAFTAGDLAQLLRVDAEVLSKVLDRLERNRILRRQSRKGVLWYELYHDLFSDPIEKWNDIYKTKQRNKRAFILMGSFFLVGFVLYVIYDVVINYTNYHMRLSVMKGVSDRIELYQGKADSQDFFGLKDYIAETRYQRAQVEADKLFKERGIGDYHELNSELIGLLPLTERIEAYLRDGQVKKALILVEKAWTQADIMSSTTVPYIMDKLLAFRSSKVIKFLERLYKKSEDARVKNLILNYTMLINSPEVIAWMLEARRDQEPTVRSAAAYALGQLGGPQAVEPLIEMLKDRDNSVRQTAVYSLMWLGNTQAVEPLIGLLEDRDNYTRQTAISALGQLGSSKAIEPLIGLLKDRDSLTRQAAVSALGQLGSSKAAEPLIGLLKDRDNLTRQTAVSALGQLGSPEAAEPLIELLKDRDSYIRQTVASALGQLGSSKAVGPLIESLKDWDSATRQTAMSSLAQLGSPKAVGLLIEWLGDQDPFIRQIAAETLGQIGGPTAVVSLIERLSDQDLSGRQSASETLDRVSSPKLVDELIELLRDQNPDVRRASASALGQLGCLQAVEPLIELLEDRDDDLRRTAAEVIGQLGSPRAISVLREKLKDQDLSLRLIATNALKQLDIPDVSSLSSRGISRFGKQTKQTPVVPPEKLNIQMIVNLLKAKSLTIKVKAIGFLGRSKKTSVLSHLHPLLLDSNFKIQLAAANALSQIASPTSVSVLRNAILNSQTTIRVRFASITALGKIGTDAAVKAILEVTEKDETSFGDKVYRILGETKARQALPLLSKRLKKLENNHKQWRKIRDSEREDFTNEEAEIWRKKLEAAKSEFHLVLELAHAMARIDPEDTGIKLLSHDLADVRSGAWTGLGTVGTVDLLRRLYLERLKNKSPIFRHAYYRAIDDILVQLETNGGPQELAELETLWPQIKDIEGVGTRVEWTIRQLKEFDS